MLVLWRQKKPPIASDQCWAGIYKGMADKVISSHPLLASESLKRYCDLWRDFDYSRHYGQPNKNEVILRFITTPLPPAGSESRALKQRQAGDSRLGDVSPNQISPGLVQNPASKHSRQRKAKALKKLEQSQHTMESTEVVIKPEKNLDLQNTALSVPAWVRGNAETTLQQDDRQDGQQYGQQYGQQDTPVTCPPQGQNDMEMENIETEAAPGRQDGQKYGHQERLATDPPQAHSDTGMENTETEAAPDTTPAAAVQTPVKTPAPNVTTRSSAGKRKALEPLDENLPDNKKQKSDTEPVTPHHEEAPSPVAGQENWSSRLRSSAVKKEPEPEPEGHWQSREVIVILD